ncbi:hypothetical protein CR194_03655 [Salipaludibacillus keqinensis]|uniref:Uncharacterized protein n=1 Tax=Salipaludibacillus keqinensis TaxID=2045207 RepID=A0A323TKL0_9BACI|nr:hypothetical protein [Salipaludibacillus keqinensis]PYZ94636.1 hypothetical protein CR194_03655 [Salipaludibacillus keqinensis]
MNKKDLFKDVKRLLKDLKTQDRSTVARSEESQTKSGLSVKKDYVIRGKVGLPGNEEKNR